MTALVRPPNPLDFALTEDHEAHEPPEARGLRRDSVQLLVSRGDAAPVTTHFTSLGDFFEPGDLLLVNTSSTMPSALDGRLHERRTDRRAPLGPVARRCLAGRATPTE